MTPENSVNPENPGNPTNPENLKAAQTSDHTEESLEYLEYDIGRAAFEAGRYRQAVIHLEAAQAQVQRDSPLGGEIQLWLATAYQALGREPEAVALCRQLTKHSQITTRKQARRLLEVLESPVLSNNANQIQLPDWSQIERNPYLDYRVNPAPRTQPKSTRLLDQSDSPEIGQDVQLENGFLWVALGGLVLILGSLLLLG
ncbi:MAG: tetratricopeptide repeat protein [Oscillatoriales cyanobacterium RM2_1_1]|nr:tetratricopeptide repeat protein [Oscillatoriales cyanobacterium SM2_3_0]NJO47836.1 tetratricopeptide repeat protein [Oscillatoriales cyanobacterium RM2_1_1]